MEVLLGYDAHVATWVSGQLGGIDFGLCSAIGIAREGNLIAGVVYNNYHTDIKGKPLLIEMSVAATEPHWLTKNNLRVFFAYPFHKVGVVRVQSTIARRNMKSRKFCEGLGFKFEGIARKAHPMGGDAACYSLLKSECKWIR